MQRRIALLHIVVHPDPHMVALLHSDLWSGRGSIDDRGFPGSTICGDGVIRDAKNIVGLPCLD